MNCQLLKEKYLECLRESNVGFDVNVLKFRANSIGDNMSKLQISEKVLKKCNADKLAECLNHKYNMNNYDDNKMYSYYGKKFDNMMSAQEKKQHEENLRKQK
jgi:hypothetical protein